MYSYAWSAAFDAISTANANRTDDAEPTTGTVTYTAIGNVRGSCGHKHRTAEAAEACFRRDMAGCRRQGGYSDRCVRAFIGGVRAPSHDPSGFEG